jgi:hypothetical protein
MNYDKRRRKQIVDERGPLPAWYRSWKPTTYPERDIELPEREDVEAIVDPEVSADAVKEALGRMGPLLYRLAALPEEDRSEFFEFFGGLDDESQVTLLRFLVAFAADD